MRTILRLPAELLVNTVFTATAGQLVTERFVKDLDTWKIHGKTLRLPRSLVRAMRPSTTVP